MSSQTANQIMSDSFGSSRYVLMTAAHNEESSIGRTIESVLMQTRLPKIWAIVNDGSNDGTDQIIESFVSQHSFMKLIRVARAPERCFAAKVKALRAAYQALDGVEYELIGNIDADVTIGKNYFAELVWRMDCDPALGIGGGFVYEKKYGRFVSRPLNSRQSVPHAAQLVRKACYESIGGYAVMKYGGEDWHAAIMAQMKGWRTEAFEDLIIYHFRRTEKQLRSAYRAGKMDYSVGSYTPFEVVKCVRRMGGFYFLGGIARMCGYLWAQLLKEERDVSDEFVGYLRNVQKQRLKIFLKCLLPYWK